jgi:broad specificity phosphatase PhoE
MASRYSFLDARGVGALEGLRLGTVYQQVFDGDQQDANWHPPKGYDGTPPESAADVLTRMRQLLSVTETQYTGEDVVIITPDSDTLSILQVILTLLQRCPGCLA